MAPRPAGKPGAAPVAGGARPAPIGQDDLANKLKAQRAAAEKLAEQRVNTARQRTDEPAKPKFTFAESDAPKPPQGQRPPQSPALQPRQTPPIPQASAPQLQPARQQLGQGAGAKPLPPAAPPSYAQQPPAQRGFTPPPQPQNYQRQYTQPPYPQQPGYRPIDPATGYAQPPAYVPPQQRPNYAPPAYPTQPAARVPAPTRSSPTGYAPGQPDLRATPRLGSAGALRAPPPVGFEDDQDDIFEQPAAPVGRRATANDYQQAYNSAEPEYEEDLPRSRLPLILMILLVLALASGIGGIWAYNNLIKGASTASGDKASAPVVAAPAQPAKVSPDASTSTKTDQASQPAAGANKKQIYDRIVGDHEVISGQMKPNEETPVQPDANAAPPAPGDTPPAASTGTGNDGTPLPLPPPPGSSGGTQGSLDQNKGSNVAQIAPAAEPSSAAVSTGGQQPASTNGQPASKQLATAEPPVPSTQPSKLAAADPAENTITDQSPASPQPQANAAGSKVADTKKPAVPKTEKNLGGKPLVLVPPAKVASSEPTTVATTTPLGDAQNSLYNGPAVGAAPATNAGAAAAGSPAPVAKRKTLSDLFKTTTPAAAPTTSVASANVPAAPATTNSPVAGGYVAQLASFKTKEEASAEYARLVQKHGAIISKYAPMIETAEVAGSPRFRLNIGPMPTMETATNVCSSLFSAGERDCVVHRQ
jgi:hypothetical protein